MGCLLAGLLLIGACTSSPVSDEPSPSPLTPATPEAPASTPGGPGSAQRALERLCRVKVEAGGSGVPAEGPTPPAIERIMRQVEQIRGFEFSRSVVAQPSTPEQIARGLASYMDLSAPAEQFGRRSLAWQTIGVIPRGTEIREELAEYGDTHVIGYYNTVTGELVFLGGEDPSPLEGMTLAHELTHAIEDQRFGLERLDSLAAECRDDEAQGAIAVVEGTATYFMYDWARTFLSAEEQVRLADEIASQDPPPSVVEPFVLSLQLWPYTSGLGFVTQLERRGGIDAVDAALEDLPVSSEQIIHPERYPNDLPTLLDVPDFADELGRAWRDLDVMEVGEAWLDIAFGLRLDDAESGQASAGWDGGVYRAWSDGNHVAVVLATAWDSERDANEFEGSMRRWIDEGTNFGVVLERRGKEVRALFASDAQTLDALEAAATA